ncbi:MAG: sulfotransferase, partial [Atribacterota bacterium]
MITGNNHIRKKFYQKKQENENFLQVLNSTLNKNEKSFYLKNLKEFPCIHIIGAPRSGTTLLAQLLSYCLSCGYIDSIAARFWLSPVYGLKLSKSIFGCYDDLPLSLGSHYGVSNEPNGIHEFGYFWRHWLKRDSFSRSLGKIDWNELKLTVLNMQHTVGGPICFKNFYASLVLEEFHKTFPKSIFIWIDRDPFDSMVSILNARRSLYNDVSCWWSYAPPNYNKIKSLSPHGQILNQVFYLRNLFQNKFDKISWKNCYRFDYKDVCSNG